MNRRELMVSLAVLGTFAGRARAAASAEEWLITPEEYSLELKKRETIGPSGRRAEEDYWGARPKAGPGSPEIVVRSPNMAAPIKGPVKIDVAFVPAPDATIDLASFKVTYGILGIDVTERVKRYATITAQGVLADLPSMPKGKHSFELQIADNLKRSTRQRVRCEVAG
jgi:hypothetical protein